MLTQAELTVDRSAFIRVIDELMSGHEEQGQCLALLIININNFKRANTLFGFPAGDSLLDQVVGRLYQIAVSPEMVGRLSGHAFGMLVPNLHNTDEAELAATKVIRLLSDTFELQGHRFRTRISVGVALYPDHAWDAEGMIEKGELVLASAVENNRNVEVYTERTKNKLGFGWDVENALISAIEKDEFELNFQPKLDLRTGEPFAAEALLRWNSSEKGLLMPNDFIPVAEESGLIMDLTDMVLDAALRQASEWPDKWGNLSVAVNVSTHALREPALPELILEALNNWHFQPELLTLEITESAFMSDFEVSYLNLNIIRNSGVRISVDDFGTGYSCLSQFKRIPADELKIDKSFVYDMIDDEQNKHIVDLIIELAHRFNLKAVAEGIEEIRTLETLIDAGCDYGQGFLFGQSMPQSVFIEWIRKFKRIM